jgi:hypothetical protein
MIKKVWEHLLLLLLTTSPAIMPLVPITAQEISKEVYVVRPYEPTLSDATKYNFLPSTDDAETKAPRFDYSITPKRLVNSFEPDPIKAAKTITTSLPKIYNSWLKLGFGNYVTPLAEFNISNLRSKDYAYGAYLFHKSSQGKIVLPNNQKVTAGYAVNNINLYGKRFYSKTTLTGNLRFDHNAFHYYGYNTDLNLDPLPDPDRDSTRQNTYLTGVDLEIGSAYDDLTRLNYKVSASVDYFADKLKYKETSTVVKAGFTKEFLDLLGGLDMSLDYFHLKGAADSVSNTIFRFHPWISKQSADWKFNLGFEATADKAEITNFYFYPKAHLDIIIIQNVLVPFLGLSGELQQNGYKNTFSENTFINPGTFYKNSSSNLIAYAGVKGSISSVVRFRADVSYTVFKNYHFFVNDTLLPLDNRFTEVYDDIDLITYHGQLAAQPSRKFEMLIDGKYFNYKTFDEARAWHKPDFEIGIDASYRFGEKLTAGLGLTVTGNRWVRHYQAPDDMMKIKPVTDINLKLNYQYSKLFSLFADFYNLSDRSYMIWNQYPSQRFNFLFGFSYKL